jgi:ElaB/YqjD/DUF883 family membrane-anchored ribosome-binding protein
MKRIFSSLKTVLTVVLAGILLIINTACSNASMQARSAGPNPPGQAQPDEGGMNNFRDIDTTRLDPSGADAKAKALRDAAEKRIGEKRVDSVEQYVENYRTGTPLGERTERFAKDLKRGVEDITEDTKNITQRGSKELQRNTDRASDKLGRAATNATENVKGAGQDLVEGVKDIGNQASQAGERASDFVQGKSNEAAGYSKAKVDDAAGAAKRAIDKAA